MPDPTNPDHYKRLDPEPIVVIERWGLGFCLGNAVKYISRAGNKPGADVVEDLAKARWYLDRAIAAGRAEQDNAAGESPPAFVGSVDELAMHLEQIDACVQTAEYWRKTAGALADRIRELTAATPRPANNV